MANTLATLIKLAAQKVEKVQQELATLQRQLAEVHAGRQKWREAETRGDKTALEELAQDNPRGLLHAGLFRERVVKELAFLAKVEAALDEKIAAVRQRLNGHYAEQKRYEILHEQQLLAERKKHAKKVQAQLDESAGQRRP